MPPSILSTRSHATLASFVGPDVLMAFDFDGVLAPIVPVSERAHLRVRTRDLLTRLAGRFPCIVVSGRLLADLAPRLEGIPLRMVFGNFGYEPPLDGQQPPAIVAQWVTQLEHRLSGERGIVVEDKAYSVAVHYRHAPNPKHAHALIRDVLAGFRGARVLEGTLAMMLVPKGGPTKGSTLQAARRRLACRRAVYFGDDGTDEDAFASGPPERLLSVRVGAAHQTLASYQLEHQTLASYQLEHQADLDHLLSQILAMSRP